jgi:mannose-1-phosphate guanylyltransferase
MMPFVSGLDVLEELRRMPHRSDIPVIILTAKGQDADRTNAMELGATDFFTKPFSPRNYSRASMSSSSEERYPHLWTVILAGGIGSRFWPASTPAQPKQLLKLASEKPLIRDTVERILPLIGPERLRILTGAASGGTDPRGAPGARTGESPARAARGRHRAGPRLGGGGDRAARPGRGDGLPARRSRHRPGRPVSRSDRAYRRSRREHRRLFTIGARPDRPETGYGYIRVGDALEDTPAGLRGGFEVDAFVEKPDAGTAATYLRHGGYLWNTGIFVWRVADLLDQLERHTPELARLVPIAREGGTEEFFRLTPNLSIDEGLLERSDRVAVAPADFDWDDVGAWDAIYRTKTPDARGNVVVGNGFPVDSDGCALYSEGGPIVAFGVEDLIIVRTAGTTFVTTRERSAELKRLLAALPEEIRDPD